MLNRGTKIGNYEIVEPIGAGGMGEIYRARDTRLDRSVAIKSLPVAFAGHGDRLERFEREARILASLNHPNIAAIYGFEDASGSSYIVLEFVEGESLAQRLARGSLEVRETLEIGGQIASAIEAAHERGIVHRDLKPGNVMITPARVVKVLDFGLAKGMAEAGSVAGPSAATFARSATADGLILGTAPYMSPEQARGKEVDRRTDVWAFGCILFECLTAHPSFGGETVSDVIADILDHEPDWEDIPGSAPPRLRDLIRRCLTKDAQERPRDIGDIRRELNAILGDISSPGHAARASSLPSLAVLYFENLANDPESEYFCAGITEDILTDLSKIKGLRVASRNAVARYRGAPADIPRVASDLGVRAVLEGSVRRAGDRVRISAQLVNASDGFHLWAERYDRKLEDVFDVQEEISHSIAEALRVALTPAESKNLVQNRPNDARAYDLYLKGRERYGRYSKDDMAEALRLFREATEIDPGYALAWAGIADSYAQMVQWSMTTEIEQTLRLGLEAADRAISLSPRLAEGHKAQALVMRLMGNESGERRALNKAIEVNPRYIPALVNLAVLQYSDADIAGAERSLRRVMEIDPQEAFATTWVAAILMDTGRTEEAAAMVKRVREIAANPFYILAYYMLRASVDLLRNDVDAAEQTMNEALEAGADRNNLRALQAAIAARRGKAEEVRDIFRELSGLGGLGVGAVYALADAAIRIGEVDLAMPFVQRSVVREIIGTMARITPSMYPLLDRPPLAPRRSEKTLVWPLEAPMMHPSVLPLFREVRIESGRPPGSESQPRSSA